MMIRKYSLLLALLAVVTACGKAPQPPAAPPHADGPPRVTVSTNQLKMFKVDPVGTYNFSPSAEVIGTISFSEDPSVIQAETAVLTTAAANTQMSKELDRAQQLRLTNGISERELEQARSDAATARANYLSARFAALALGKTPQELDKLIAGGTLPRALSKGFAYLSLAATEADGEQFRPGTTVEVSTPDLPNEHFRGRLLKVFGVVDPNTHRLTLRGIVADPHKLLKPGMLVTAVVSTGSAFEAIAVPDATVVREGDGTLMAWIESSDRTFEQRPIQIGYRQNGRVQITAGLRSGERIVTDGGLLLDNMLQGPAGD